ncbi:hypothetical protein HDU84_003911 [Entophlyctis sp. JEL0112]|nr:hypothetical protein HDU84_003911 [Entophlyctis sp. JEL0112]
MDSYPRAYLAHHAPLMWIAGLREAAPADSADAALLAALQVRANERDSLATGALFRCTLFDGQTLAQRIPLSPRDPASPLYPDGIMAPQWLERYRSQSPSNVVMFARLSEPPEELYSRINAIRVTPANTRKTAPVPYKFAVVLMLEENEPTPVSAATDARIQALRRACQLDSKNSVILFPHGSSASEFVPKLQRLLYDDAVAFYREHGRRAKKKKGKIIANGPVPARGNSGLISIPVPSVDLLGMDSPDSPASLSQLGWNVRHDYKMGVFAEFRQDLETAMIHYQYAYQYLVEMFHSTLSSTGFLSGNGFDHLTPFTQRWTDARIFSDCVSIKMCKLSFFLENPFAAMSWHQKHMANFKILPEFAGEMSGSAAALAVPGLRLLASLVPGNGSYEYWAWVSKQCRVFGELVEGAVNNGLRVPFPPAGSSLTATALAGLSAGSVNSQTILHALSVTHTSGTVSSGHDTSTGSFAALSTSVPSIVIQNAGYYYYLSASCSEERWARFRVLEEFLKAGSAVQSSNTARSKVEQASRAAERHFDHGTHTIDILTKSYEQFKRAKNGRMTLFLAAEIARIYEASGKSEMALKFFERIAKTYRKEKWNFAIVASILRHSVACARRLERWTSVVEALIELVSEDVVDDLDQRNNAWEEVLDVLSAENTCNRTISTERLLVNVDMDKINSFLEVSAGFEKRSSFVKESLKFQVKIDSRGLPRATTLSTIRVLFSDKTLDNLWMNDISLMGIDSSRVSFVDFSASAFDSGPSTRNNSENVSISRGDLLITPGKSKVFQGALRPLISGNIAIVGVVLGFEKGDGVLSLNYCLSERSTATAFNWYDTTAAKPRFVTLRGNFSKSQISQREPNIKVNLIHDAPVILDRIHSVALEIINCEDEEIDGIVDIDKTSRISVDKELMEVSSETPDAATSAGSSSSNINLLSDFPSTSNSPRGALNEEKPMHQNNILRGVSLGRIAAHGTKTVNFHICASKYPGERKITSVLSFRRDEFRSSDGAEMPTDVQARHTYSVSCIAPFDAVFAHQPRALSVQAKSGNSLLSGGMLAGNLDDDLARMQGWTVTVALKSQAPVFIEEAKFTPKSSTEHNLLVDAILVDESAVNGIMLEAGDTRNYVVQVNVKSSIDNKSLNFEIGGLHVSWKRDEDCDLTHSLLKIPALDYSFPDLWTCVKLPDECRVGKPFSVAYQIQNSGLSLVDLSMAAEPSDGCVFSGHKAIPHLRLLPLSAHELKYVVVPLVAGLCKLPRIKVTRRQVVVDVDGDESGGHGVRFVDEAVPAYVFGGGLAEDLAVYVLPSAEML